jgi:hypothetical protein
MKPALALAVIALSIHATAAIADVDCDGYTDDGGYVYGECSDDDFEGYGEDGDYFYGECEAGGEFDATSSEGDHASGDCQEE